MYELPTNWCRVSFNSINLEPGRMDNKVYSYAEFFNGSNVTIDIASPPGRTNPYEIVHEWWERSIPTYSYIFRHNHIVINYINIIKRYNYYYILYTYTDTYEYYYRHIHMRVYFKSRYLDIFAQISLSRERKPVLGVSMGAAAARCHYNSLLTIKFPRPRKTHVRRIENSPNYKIIQNYHQNPSFPVDLF